MKTAELPVIELCAADSYSQNINRIYPTKIIDTTYYPTFEVARYTTGQKIAVNVNCKWEQ